MSLLIISGSHRKQSQSIRISNLLLDEWTKLFPSLPVKILSLAENPLPLWDESVWGAGDPKWEKTWKPMAADIRAAQGFIVVTPEWGGMVPAGLKNLFLFAAGDLMAHKPALITSVSSGMGGAYPVVELRQSSYKNSRICYLPDHLIFRSVESLFTGDSASFSKIENDLLARVQHHLRVLKEYMEALSKVRASGVIDLKKFANGQ